MLEPHRRRIDALDLELLALLSKRARVALQIAEAKARAGLPVVDPDRERQVVARLQARNPGPLSDAALARVYAAIMAEMRALQRGGDPPKGG